jgi:hypothetical protein
VPPRGCIGNLCPNAALRGRFRAVWASPPAVPPSVAHSVFCLPRICGATRPSLARRLYLFIFLFHFLIYFISQWWLSGILSRLCVFFNSLALLAHFQYDVLY